MSSRLAMTLAAAAWGVSASAQPVEPYRLAPFKDDLFAYRNVLAADYGGDFLKVEFNTRRDLDERSQAPQVAKPEYVSLDVRSMEADLVLRASDLTVRYVGVGRTAGGARAVVINIHGLGDDRFSGVNDWTYGGNQNRLKNLMALNEGAYLSPDFSAVPSRAEREIKALISEYAANAPGAPIFLVCISLGGRICWALAQDREIAWALGGILFLSTDDDYGFLARAKAADPVSRLPIFIGHGTRDPIFNWRPREAFFRRFKAAVPDYPIQLTLFVGGAHGAPVRMTDWRLVLNWMLAAKETPSAGPLPDSTCSHRPHGAPMPIGPGSPQDCPPKR